MKHTLRIFLLSLLVSSAAGAMAQTKNAAPPEDTQSWNDLRVSIPAGKRVEFLINGTLRVGNNASRLVDERAGGGILVQVNKYLSLSPTYLYIATQPAAGRDEHRRDGKARQCLRPLRADFLCLLPASSIRR